MALTSVDFVRAVLNAGVRVHEVPVHRNESPTELSLAQIVIRATFSSAITILVIVVAFLILWIFL